jgi:hypothetical protein
VAQIVEDKGFLLGRAALVPTGFDFLDLRGFHAESQILFSFPHTLANAA